MKSDTPLDRVVLQLASTRASCEVLAVAGDETEKVADGLIEPFLQHVEAANDQFGKGDYSIKLETAALDAPTWFTRGTLERFVRLLSDPEILESVCAVHEDIQQLDEAPWCMGDEAALDSTTTSVSNRNLETENAEFNLKEREEHRATLYRKQFAAFSRATSAGFTAEAISSLIRFCTVFGVTRILDVCDRYMKLCMQKRETEIWLGKGGSSDTMEKQANSCLENCTAAGEVVSPTSLARDDNDESLQDDGDRRLSVQEKIIMFESKKEDTEKRRMSAAEAGKTDVHKPVLRRWSLAVEKIAASPHRGDGSNEKISEVDEEVRDGSQQTQTVGLPELEHNQDEHKSEDQTSAMSGTQSFKETKGRMYEQYREKRDAKLKEESTSLKAERQERLRAMQESLERRRAEAARTLRSKKADPLAEARVRAEKLRAFKAELKKMKEEEEKKRLEEIRLQRLQKTSSPRSGGSTPRQHTVRGRSTLNPTFQRASPVGAQSNQAAANNRSRRSCDTLGHLAPPFAEENGKPRVSTKQDKADGRLRSTLRKSMPALRGGIRRSGQADGLKCIGLNEIAEAPEDIKEVLAVEGNGSNLGGMVIRAPVTATEDENEKFVGDDNSVGTDGEEKDGEPSPRLKEHIDVAVGV